MMGKSLELYLRQSERIWRYLPSRLKSTSAGRAYGKHLHALVCRHSKRRQSYGTFFMRNRPEMELMCRLIDKKPPGDTVEMAVLACSKGAEVYSIVWCLRRSRPDLKIVVQAVDISQEIIDFAKEGTYALKDSDAFPVSNGSALNMEEQVIRMTTKDQGRNQSESIFQRLDRSEMDAIFDVEGDQARVKSWLREGITWRIGDASSPELINMLGAQDLVVANRFLCHMEPAAAERCLRNVASLVKPDGYLFVSGVDLAIRTKVAKELHLMPVPDLIREIHEGDSSLAAGWPLEWWGLEPFCRDYSDWAIRYASVFQIGLAPSKHGATLSQELMSAT